MKESRYFLESSYKMVARKRDFSAVGSFRELFPECKKSQLRLEATPDYLYSDIALKRIKEEIPDTKFVFILREPVSRLKSWFRYSRQLRLISPETSFDDYIQHQMNMTDAPQHLRSLEQGRYSNYLEKAAAICGVSNILVCFFEDLEKAPENLCKQIAEFAGIDPGYFTDFNFMVYNKSTSIPVGKLTRLFRALRRSLKPVKQNLPGVLMKKLKLASHYAEGILIGKANKNTVSTGISDQNAAFLKTYYAAESDRIQKIMGVKPPWNRIENQ
jgi:hypothetical protein